MGILILIVIMVSIIIYAIYEQNPKKHYKVVEYNGKFRILEETKNGSCYVGKLVATSSFSELIKPFEFSSKKRCRIIYSK